VSVPVTTIVAELQPKLQGSGNWNPAGIGGKKVLSSCQLAAFLMDASKVAGNALVTVQLYLALIALLMATVFALDSAAGRTEELEEKKQFTREASQVLLMLIPAMKVGEAWVPW
jgi:hypothetical protein